MHPREKHLKEYNKIKELDQNKIKIHIHQNVNHLYELLSKSSLLINFRLSTTILEATILGVPSITIPLVKNMPSFFKDLDPSIHLILNDSLRTEIKNVLEHPNINQQIRDRTIKEFFTKIDGKSSQRATKLILKLANS